jgi:hypothetical protein
MLQAQCTSTASSRMAQSSCENSVNCATVGASQGTGRCT